VRLRINTLALLGAERRYTLTPGLNIVSGSVATGKTTLLRCMRGLLGDRLDQFPREARETITSLAGEIVIGDDVYDIVRPFVTTDTARVDIAGAEEVRRLPAFRAIGEESTTYGNWLLEKLHLPRLNVPTAPTQPDSASSPLSINDYMMYCHLRQDEIDSSVFGHTNQFKNTKRKFVFEVVYGKYDVEISSLQEEVREVYGELRRLRSQGRTIAEFITGTPFENRAAIERDLREAEAELERITRDAEALSAGITEASDTEHIKRSLQGIESELDELHRRLQFEKGSAEQKERLIAQLQTQSTRITRSVVAGEHLLDFDFITCPRCGSAVSEDRADPETCYLCLQQPSPQIAREDLIREQDRLEKQISETRELVAAHMQSVREIDGAVESLGSRRREVASELDYRTRTFISARGEMIARAASDRAALQEQIKRLREYLGLFERQSRDAQRIAQLESRYADLQAALESALSNDAAFDERVHFLEVTFRDLLERIRAPRFASHGPTVIDRRTYLPIYDGRRFDELQSQGLQVMVNVAHAVAHQLTAIHYELPLPNILLVDGLTGNIGYEGLDMERVEAIYRLLIDLAAEHQGRLQIIVADNSTPHFARELMLAEFSEQDKLIPQHVLETRIEEE
jgi:hypothetical protein